MKSARCLVLVVFVAVNCAGSDSPANSPPPWPAADTIRDRREAQNDALARQDLAAVQRFWTDDVMVTASGGTGLVGAVAYREALANQFARFGDVTYVRTPHSIQRSTVDSMAVEEGTWVGTWTDAEPVTVQGVYMAQWRRENGQWLIRSEVFVATVPERMN